MPQCQEKTVVFPILPFWPQGSREKAPEILSQIV